jgi:hypothetical protein
MTTLRELRDEYVMCRTLRHSWDEHPTPEVNPSWWKVSHAALYLRCIRCGTERSDYYDANLDLMHRDYRYPNEYRATRTGGVVALRGEMFRRSLLLKRKRRPNGKAAAA